MTYKTKLNLLAAILATTLFCAGCAQTGTHASSSANPAQNTSSGTNTGTNSTTTSSTDSSTSSSGSSTGSSSSSSSGSSGSGSSSTPTADGNSAQFVKEDTVTEGNWPSAYGSDGHSLAGSNQSLPSYATFTQTNALIYTWNSQTNDSRALPVPGAGSIAAAWYNTSSYSLNIGFNDSNTHVVALYALDYDNQGRVETIQMVDASSGSVLDSEPISNFSNGVYLVWNVSGNVKINVTKSAGPNAVVSGVFFGSSGTTITSGNSGSGSGSGSSGSSGSSSGSSSNPNCPTATNAVTFNGIDSTTQGAWKGAGNFNAAPASSSLVYGKDGDILPDTENCDTSCNPFPSYVTFGPSCAGASTVGNIGSKPYSTHAYVAMVQGSSGVMGAEPQNTSNTNYFQCNYTFSNAAAPWAPMVAWRPTVDTREISNWYTCSGIPSFYLELDFGSSAHNFEVYVVDDQNGGSLVRSEQIQVLDGDSDAVLYDSGSFTNFTGGLYYKWTLTGHVKIKVINTATNGTSAVVNGVFFN
jgi:hypothetical protein